MALFGREAELAAVEDLVAHIYERGGSLMIRGDAGVGKSALLDEAVERATRHGATVLRTAGVPSESRLAFAGLHQLLAPHLDRISALPGPQSAALSAAFGLQDAGAPDVFLIALAALDLLADAASSSPLVLVIEDAHWLDADSWQVLTFVARRLELEPIALLFAVREGHASRRDDAPLPQLRLRALDTKAAALLLDAHVPGLAPALRGRVLDMAGGNPLALLELPRAASTASADGPMALVPLPITATLERAFSEQLATLPEATRRVLLVAAADDGGTIDQMLDAAAAIEGRPVTAEELDPAEAAGLVRLREASIEFRHPLVRAAIYHGATRSARVAAHAALADAHADDPDLSTWHRAASCLGADARVASALEATANRALRRGAPAVAAAAVERSAQLAESPATRGRRLLQAGEMQFELGRPDLALRLLTQARPLVPDKHEQARISLLLEEADENSWSSPERVASSAAIASEMAQADDSEHALGALLTVARSCWWGNPSRATREQVLAAVDQLDLPQDSPALVAILGCTDPIGRGAEVLDSLSRMRADRTLDPMEMHMAGTAATTVWAFDRSMDFLSAAVDGLRAQGRLGLLAQALVSQSWAALHCAKQRLALSAADEASRLARETDQARWAVAADLVKATVAGERGDRETLDALAAGAEAELLAIGAQPMLALVRFARGRGAVAHQEYAEGFDELRRALDPGDLSYHPFVGAWGLPDLIEAAGQLNEARAADEQLDRLRSLAETTTGTFLRAGLQYVQPLLASDEDAEELYLDALSGDLSRWPCFRGRLLLAYGRWLRRRRRIAESRAPLRAARDSFDALGFSGLAERAREELRASGETSRSRGADLRDRLTPQELQIAQLAASGLSNREIGRQLYLSHRTVGSHLYRMFPKLGVSSRGQLGSALAGLPEGAG